MSPVCGPHPAPPRLIPIWISRSWSVPVTSGSAHSVTGLLHTRYDDSSAPPTPRPGTLVGPSGQP